MMENSTKGQRVRFTILEHGRTKITTKLISTTDINLYLTIQSDE